MDENINHTGNKFGEQLPLHSPDTGTWQRISDKLDISDAETAYQERLQGLPVHSPDHGTWNLIYSRLNRIAYYKTGVRIAVSIAAGLLLFFTVSRISDTNQPKTYKSVPQLARQAQSVNPLAVTTPSDPVIKQTKADQQKNKPGGNVNAGNNGVAYVGSHQESNPVVSKPAILPSGNNALHNTAINQESITVEAGSETAVLTNSNPVNNEVSVQPGDNAVQATQSSSMQNEVPPDIENSKTKKEIKSILFQNEHYAATTPPPVKYYTPEEPNTGSKANHFALDMNYLPENIYNGTDNSLFHNVDLTAIYNKGKVRFNTSLGMAYNEEQFEFNVSYNINTPVTAMGPEGNLDTLSYNFAKMDSEYTGYEKHQYITYNLGLGRQLFSSGKFSTWLNLGAGLGVLLNDPDLVTSTANSVKSLYNANSVRINTSKPVYNDLNVNVVTAIDVNYKILNRLSITLTPTSRWYLKSVLSVDSQSTDQFTLGFRTGLKFDF